MFRNVRVQQILFLFTWYVPFIYLAGNIERISVSPNADVSVPVHGLLKCMCSANIDELTSHLIFSGNIDFVPYVVSSIWSTSTLPHSHIFITFLFAIGLFRKFSSCWARWDRSNPLFMLYACNFFPHWSICGDGINYVLWVWTMNVDGPLLCILELSVMFSDSESRWVHHFSYIYFHF
jgi:hypothetical protein